MKRRATPLTPSALRAAHALFPKANKTKLQQVARIVDHETHLACTIRTCAVVLRDLQMPDCQRKRIGLVMARFALRDVLLACGFKLDQINKIIG
jgi:hypothetical protein